MGGAEDGGSVPGEVGEAEEGALAAAREVLHPAIPAGAAAIIAATDPRLNRPSETEEELRELVESNAAADDEDQRAGKGPLRPSGDDA